MPPSSTDDDAPAIPLVGGALSWTEEGEPRSARFGDVYFSKDDGLAESRAVFLAGCGLPEAWAGREHFTVGELGFGTGLNIVALLDLWRRDRPEGGQLTVFSIEAWPLTAAEAMRALTAWPELAPIVDLLIARWPAGTPGFHRIDLPELSATLDLAIGDVDWALDQWRGRADAWFLDGFSPATNPDMWSPEVFAAIARRSAPDVRLGTFTVAGAVRRGLAEQGYQVDKRPGHGRKRERLEARGLGIHDARVRPSIAVIGAGIAGAAVARALSQAGADVTVIEADLAGAGASGFPAALVTPRLDAGDTVIAGFHAQALGRAGQLYARIPGAVISHGVLQREQAARDAARFAKVAAQPWWPSGDMAERCVSTVPIEPSEAGLMMNGALSIRPSVVLDAWLDEAALITAEVGAIERDGTGWQVLDIQGRRVVSVDQVVVTAGWGTSHLLPDLALRPVRGQADWIVDPALAGTPAIAWGGYLAPTGNGILFGATHDRDETATDVRASDSLRNRATLAVGLPDLAARLGAVPADGQGARAAVRATTPDRLPVCGTMEPGLHVLSGLGSRGFCVAPLLGDHLAAILLDRPSPLPAAFADRLSPLRAVVRTASGPLGPLPVDDGK
ncbi:tRNA (5-methylaminomethyl-2-thiouridine)(34)-methyltransferase MnmD [soil metagenome]